ncbi:MAG: tRNA epoxyqueuosine(34) reductase QueG [Alphaproteobacteria bacterium]
MLEGEGFCAAGVARAGADTALAVRLSAFLGAGWHGEMAWLGDRVRLRTDPGALWPDAKSAILAGLSYAPAQDPLAALADKRSGAISIYAQGADYHDVLKARLARVAKEMSARWRATAKVMVDTAALMEKPLAQKAGLGWQGKHTNLVSRQEGSWLFLGAILTDLDLPEDAPEADHCGSCRACLDVCPTNAFPAPYQLDARRCISYLTIEHKGPIPRELRPAIGNRIYGCDDCLAVCPWNKFAAASRELAFAPRAEIVAPRLAELANLDDAAFRRMFAGSPIKRIGRARFVRNVLIAIGNSADPSLAAVAEARLEDEAPLVRAAAVWALSRLLDRNIFRTLMNVHLAAERDESVRAEWLSP